MLWYESTGPRKRNKITARTRDQCRSTAIGGRVLSDKEIAEIRKNQSPELIAYFEALPCLTEE